MLQVETHHARREVFNMRDKGGEKCCGDLICAKGKQEDEFSNAVINVDS
jgi:hypothetical protein